MNSRVVAVLLISMAGCKKPHAASTSAGTTTTPAADAAPVAPQGPDHEALARAFVEALGKGDAAAAAAFFARPPPAERLVGDWTAMIANRGTFVGVERTRLRHEGAADYVEVRAKLTGGFVLVDLRFAAGAKELTGLHTEPADFADDYAAPAYVDPAKFACADVDVGKGMAALPGVLCTPAGVGPFPLVIFVHGSGGGDRDDRSPGNARPFRDLAGGLASRGIASLRWDKRTHGGRFAMLRMKPEDFTVKEEYLDDVAAAIALGAGSARIDAKRIFVMGHSQGGWLTPMLVEKNPQLAGGIIMSGCWRHIALLTPAQYRYLSLANDGKIDPLEQIAIDQEEQRAKRALDPNLPLDTDPSQLPFGSSPKMWLGLQKYDAGATAAALGKPLLVLQGQRDYQVTEADDYAGWKRSLAGKDAEFHLYPKLNHEYFAGEGPIKAEEYDRLGHVDPPVIDDVAAWVSKH